jgi:hypothetical protein
LEERIASNARVEDWAKYTTTQKQENLKIAAEQSSELSVNFYDITSQKITGPTIQSQL